MRKTFYLSAVFLFLFIFLSQNNFVYAQDRTKTIEEEIGFAQINPGSNILYSLKMLKESLEMKTAGTSNIKSARYLEFSTRRIREVRSLHRDNRENLIESTLERYWVHMQNLLGNFDIKNERVTLETTEQVYKHLYILNLIYPELSDKRAKMSVRLTIYRISKWQADVVLRLNQISQSVIERRVIEHQKLACDFQIKEASSEGLNRIEKEVLSGRAVECEKSLILN